MEVTVVSTQHPPMDEGAAGSPSPTSAGVPGSGRRGFLTRIGVGGLVAAASVFGAARPALAANYGCCNLGIYPPNCSFSFCARSGQYLWNCTRSGGGTCSCCEYNRNPPYECSAGRCS